jgi:hypothetical protein
MQGDLVAGDRRPRDKEELVQRNWLSRNPRGPRRRPSVALVIACLALMVALGGTSWGDSIVGGQDGSTHAAKKKKKVKRGPRGRRGPAGPRGATGPAGPAGTAVAYGRVAANGTLDAGVSKNLAVKSKPLGGVYCLDVTNGGAKNVTAMIDNSGADPSASFVGGTAVASAIAGGCPAGTDVEIATGSGPGAFADRPFYVSIN